MNRTATALFLLLLVPLPALPAEDALFEGKPAEHWIAALGGDDLAGRQKAVWALWNLGSAAGVEAALPLSRALEDADVYVRSTAAKALQKLGDSAKPAVPVLAGLLASERQEVRRGAAFALFRMGGIVRDHVAAIAKGLDSEDPVVRANVAGCLAGAGPAAGPAAAALEKTLDDEHAEAATWASHALVAIDPIGAFDHERREVRLAAMASYMNGVREGGEPVFAAIVGTLDDEDPEVRSVAAIATGNAYLFAPKDEAFYEGAKAGVIATLVKAAGKDPAAVVREWAVYALGKIGAHADGESREAVVPTLLAAAKDAESAVRCASFQGFRSLGAKVPAAVPVLLKAMGDPDTAVRTVATLCLAAVATPTEEVIRALANGLEDWDRNGRNYAAGGLASFGPDASGATKALVACLGAHEDRRTRTAVARAIGEIGPAAKEARPVLEGILAKDAEAPSEILYALCRIVVPPPPDALARLIDRALTEEVGLARWYLGMLGAAAKPAVPGLVKLLDKGPLFVRVDAAYTLGLIGPAAKEALPALEAAAKSEDRDLAESAAEAIRVIGGK